METLSRNWGWVVVRGILANLFGVFTAFQPGITLAALVLLFGAYTLSDGVATVTWAIGARGDEPHRVPLLVGGLLSIVAGVVTFFWPALTAVTLLLLIASWAVFAGIATIAAAIRLRKEIEGEWRLVLSGLLSVTFGVVLLAAPVVGALAMVLWIGGYAIVSGVLLIALGMHLRGWGRLHSGRLMSHPA